MSNKRSLNHHHHHHHFQIPDSSQIDPKKLKSNLAHNSDEQPPIQINTINQVFDHLDESGDGGQEKMEMLMKKHKHDKSMEREKDGENPFGRLDENLVYEIFKHADGRTLAMLSCVCKIWNRTAQDERLWELICTRRWVDVNHGGGEKQLRSVVLALGGFRRLYSLYLSKTAAASTSASPSPSPSPLLGAGSKRGSKRWGKDEVNLSLSLLSIQFYEKMNNNNNNNNKGK